MQKGRKGMELLNNIKIFSGWEWMVNSKLKNASRGYLSWESYVDKHQTPQFSNICVMVFSHCSSHSESSKATVFSFGIWNNFISTKLFSFFVFISILRALSARRKRNKTQKQKVRAKNRNEKIKATLELPENCHSFAIQSFVLFSSFQPRSR